MDSQESYHCEASFITLMRWQMTKKKKILAWWETKKISKMSMSLWWQNYVKFLAQWAKNTVNKTEHDLNVWKKFFHNISENSEIEDIAADKLKYLGLPFYGGHTENKNAYKPTTIPSFQRSVQHFSNDKNSKITTCL